MRQEYSQSVFSTPPGEASREASSRREAPLRVLIAAPSLDILGGQSRQAWYLLGWLRSEPSLQVSFVPHNPRLPRPLRWLRRIKYVRTMVTSLWYWALLLIHARRCDVLHVFSASYYSYLLSAMPALLVAKLYGKKSVLNYRSGEAEDHLANWRLTGRPTMRWADVIVAPSGYLVDVFARFGLQARVIMGSVDMDHFHFRERRPLRPVFLTSRLLEPLYNVPCVLRAFALIQQRHPTARLIIAADGWLRPELENLARTLQLRDAEFIGRVPYEQMPALYDAADIYLNAPNLDNFPGSILECYAAGVPVVTTDAGGIPYILRHEVTGLMVSRDDHWALAACAMRLLEDPELATRMVRRAYEECANYSAPAESRAWIELYFELVNPNLTSDGARARLTALER